ncbi:MAG: response regulator transcription factor [Gallionella sp.]|nr:response regulator transcription factor [Gallionella sp.]
MARIIIVEDDLGQQEELLAFLTHSGHEARAAADETGLEQLLRQFTPDIVLLDYNLPGRSGAVIAAGLREHFALDIGIVMITARSMGDDRAECRRAGADDYLIKPIDFSELLALLENLIRRLKPAVSDVHSWTLSLVRSELVPPGGAAIALTGWELLLMQALANANNLLADRDTLIRALGKNPLAYDPRALETNISRLRRKLPPLDDGRNPLQAMRGMGYQFIRPLVIVS